MSKAKRVTIKDKDGNIKRQAFLTSMMRMHAEPLPGHFIDIYLSDNSAIGRYIIEVEEPENEKRNGLEEV